MRVPDNWRWRTDAHPGGPCVIVDVDGVIADGEHRQHFLRNGRRDWKNFFANAFGDTPIEGSVELTHQFDPALVVVLLSARPHDLHEMTVGWVTDHDYRWDLLVMRHHRDVGISSPEFKRRSVGELRERGFEPRLALDDDVRNIDMFRSEDVPALYVHSGYYA